MSKDNYRVIKILNEYSILINVGSEDGVKKGDSFQIYEPGEPVYDPEDHKKLIGTLDIIKAEVTAQIIYPNMAVCQSLHEVPLENTFNSSMAALMPSLAFLSKANRMVPKKLNVEIEQISGFIDENVPIQIGDLVRLINSLE